MDSKVRANVDDVLGQIDKAKKSGKHMIKIKTFQCDFKKNKKGVTIPCNIFMRVGMCSGGDGEKALLDLGYTVTYEKTTKQATSRIEHNVSVTRVKPLNTTNMIVRW